MESQAESTINNGDGDSGRVNKLDLVPHDVLKKQIVIYFETQKAEASRPALTLTSLALFIGIPLKDLIIYPESGIHFPLIQNAKARCENDLVERMFDHRIDKSTGLMFLKNHFGYTDIAKALSAEEKAKIKKENKEIKRSISDILDAIETKNKITRK